MSTSTTITKALIVAGIAAVAPISIASTHHTAPVAAHTYAAQTVVADAVNASPADFAFDTYVANTGEQDAVDECAGGVTLMESVADYVGKPYYPIHNYCGGAPILDLVDGDQVRIDGVSYTVVESVNVQRGDDASKINNLGGDALLQTCYPGSTAMRVVAVAANA